MQYGFVIRRFFRREVFEDFFKFLLIKNIFRDQLTHFHKPDEHDAGNHTYNGNFASIFFLLCMLRELGAVNSPEIPVLEHFIKFFGDRFNTECFLDAVSRCEIAFRDTVYKGFIGLFRTDKKGVSFERSKIPFAAYIICTDKAEAETSGIIIKNKKSGILIFFFQDFFCDIVLLFLAAFAGKLIQASSSNKDKVFIICQFGFTGFCNVGKFLLSFLIFIKKVIQIIIFRFKRCYSFSEKMF